MSTASALIRRRPDEIRRVKYQGERPGYGDSAQDCYLVGSTFVDGRRPSTDQTNAARRIGSNQSTNRTFARIDPTTRDGRRGLSNLLERFGPTRKTTAEYLSPSEAAELIGLHVKVIRRAISAGELPASKLRSRIRIRRRDLYGWIENGRVQARAALEDELWP